MSEAMQKLWVLLKIGETEKSSWFALKRPLLHISSGKWIQIRLEIPDKLKELCQRWCKVMLWALSGKTLEKYQKIVLDKILICNPLVENRSNKAI